MTQPLCPFSKFLGEYPMARLRSAVYPWVSHRDWWNTVTLYAVLSLPGLWVGQSLQGGMWVGRRECLAFLRQTCLREACWVIIKRASVWEWKRNLYYLLVMKPDASNLSEIHFLICNLREPKKMTFKLFCLWLFSSSEFHHVRNDQP